MPNVNLELQLKFLTELDEALTDALTRYADDGAEKLAELTYMKKEVVRARRIIKERMQAPSDKSPRQASFQTGEYREAAFS